jgi:predicted metal-dependent phosphoesterase TrpH
MKLCDLHTHSTCSDGTLTPTELVKLALEKNLAAVALTDHNTVAGLPEFLEAARGTKLEAVPGIEFSVDYGDIELHILGLFVKPEHYGPITERVEDMLRRKEQSNIDLVKNLEQAGIFLSYEDIKAATTTGQVNRALIAAEMLRKGYVGSIQEAFSKYLKQSHGYYNPPKRPDAFETIRFIRSLGAVAVWAHPFLNLKTEEAIREFLPEACKAGLQGMEVFYPKFDENQTALALQLVKEFGLQPSGGSDFHGENKPDIQLGSGKGSLSLPITLLEGLKSS